MKEREPALGLGTAVSGGPRPWYSFVSRPSTSVQLCLEALDLGTSFISRPLTSVQRHSSSRLLTALCTSQDQCSLTALARTRLSYRLVKARAVSRLWSELDCLTDSTVLQTGQGPEQHHSSSRLSTALCTSQRPVQHHSSGPHSTVLQTGQRPEQ